MFRDLHQSSVVIGFSSAFWVISCGPPSVNYVTTPVSAMQTPPPVVNRPPPKPMERAKLAVLPIEDEHLFRSERAVLRFELAGHLARVLPDREIAPFPEVDAKLHPVSQVTGHLCAFEGESIEKRARYKGWQTTHIMEVGSAEKGSDGELWVDIVDGLTTLTTVQGPWSAVIPRMDAYRRAFAGFVKNDRAGVLGGLGVRNDFKNALRDGAVTLCETKYFGACDSASADWQDRIGTVAACFSGVDELTRDLLVQGDIGPYCEIQNLDYPDGRDAKLEACLCKNLGSSAAMSKRPGRRTLRVHYESPDVQGKPRPEIRAVEMTTNIDPEIDWYTMSAVVDGKTQYRAVRRLVVDNVDALAAPLSRCAMPAGSIVLADIDLREDGVPVSGKVLSPGLDKPSVTCIEQALSRGSFNCTNDGKAARVRVSLEWRSP